VSHHEIEQEADREENVLGSGGFSTSLPAQRNYDSNASSFANNQQSPVESVE
jgi:hypothetical protein